MYFQIGQAEKDSWFSWLIGKNPESNYLKTSKNKAELRAAFDKDGTYFSGIVFRGSSAFLNKARDLNLPTYVNLQRDSVCPLNLNSFYEVFRSATRGDFKISDADVKNITGKKEVDGILEKQINLKRDMFAVLGPFSFIKEEEIERMVSFYNAFGIDTEVIKDASVDNAFFFKLTEKETLTRFLQKVYLISYALTIHYDIRDFTKARMDSQTEKFILTAEAWINECTDDTIKVKLIRSLVKKSKKLEEKFRIKLADSDNDVESIKEECDTSRFGSLHKLKHKMAIDIIDKVAISYTVNEKYISDLDGFLLKLRCLSVSKDGADYFRSEFENWDLGMPKLGLSRSGVNTFIDDFTSKHGSEKTKALIKDLILNEFFIFNKADLRIVDWGCGEMKIVKSLKKSYKKVYGYDSNAKYRDAYKGSSMFTQMNILYPDLDEKNMKPDVLLSIEVIEHFEKAERHRMLRIIRDVIQPKHIILTTPNILYNKFFENLPEGQYRHGDHKIEYTPVEFRDEVISVLGEKYVIQRIDIDFKEEDIIQPSFMIDCTIKRDAINSPIDKSLYGELKGMYDKMYLPFSGYEIRKKELSIGYSNRAFQSNYNDIFFLRPTIAPVEWCDYNPSYLEHLATGIDYYKRRGVDLLYAEKKYMGSNASILAFSDDDTAKKFGFNESIIINSRKGFPFFDDRFEYQFTTSDGNKIYSPKFEIYKEIRPKERGSFIAFDVEIMPWDYKSNILTIKDFKIPGEAAYLRNKWVGLPTGNEEKFLNRLKCYTENVPFEVRVFDILFSGTINETRNGKLRIDNTIHGAYLDRENKYEFLKKYLADNKIVKPVETRAIWLDDDISTAHLNKSVENAITAWEDYCKDGGEGFVLKPPKQVILENGMMLTPALKVRGKDYLRLIYGIDMYEESYFEQLKRRKSIPFKRAVGRQQQEISNNMIHATLGMKWRTKDKLVSSFLGVENINFDKIDRTL